MMVDWFLQYPADLKCLTHLKHTDLKYSAAGVFAALFIFIGAVLQACLSGHRLFQYQSQYYTGVVACRQY